MAPSPGDPNLVDFDAPETVIVTFRPVVPFSLADVVALCDPFSWLASLAHARSLKAQPVAVGTDEARWVLLRSSDEPFPGNNLASFEDPVRPPFYINGESDFASTLEAWFRLAGSSRLALATLFEGAMDPASSPRRRVSEAAGALERLDQTALGGHPDAALEARIASAFRRFPAAEWPSRPGDFSGEPLSGKLLRKRSRLLALKRHDVAHANIPERAGELDDRLAAATLAHLCKLVLVEQLGVAQDDAAEKMKAHFEWELVL